MKLSASAVDANNLDMMVNAAAAVDVLSQLYKPWNEEALHSALSALPLDLTSHSEHERQLAQVTTQDESSPWAWGGEVKDGDPDTFDAGFV